tara:strand:- start:655 stop:1107 length:453 start_codon:yes stop_codon:yes gene_type:complete
MVSVINAGLIYSRRKSVEDLIQEQVTGLIGKYGWMFLAGAAVLLFRSTIETSVAGLMIFMGKDYNEDDVVEVDGKPSRIVRVGMWSTTFFTYDVRDGIIVGGSKLVVQNDKLKDLKIEKPLPNLDLSKYKVDTTCQDLLTELVKSQKDKK